MNKTERLGKEKINKLLIKLSLPATVGMFAMGLYNVVDAIFIGRGVGVLGIAGITIIMPIQMLITAIGITVGIGGASIISRNLGAKNNEKANITFGNMITITIIISFIMLIIGYVFMKPVLLLFGAKGEIIQYAKDYLSVILIGTPFISFAMMSNNVIRSQGNAKVAMISMLISALTNIILDPIFIFGFNMGIKGAATASVISQFITFFYIIHFFRKGNGVIKIKMNKKYIKPKKPIVKEIFAIGMSSFVRQGSGSIMTIVLNHTLIIYGGELSVAVFGIVIRILRFLFIPMLGIAQGFLPVSGFNYGAKNYKRVKEVFKKSNIATFIIGLTGFSITMIFAKQIISLFTTDPVLIKQGIYALRIIILAIPIVGFNIIGSSYYQASGKALPALFLSLLRPIILIIPLVLIIPVLFGLNGIWYSFPIADIISVLIVSVIIIPELKHLKKLEKEK